MVEDTGINNKRDESILPHLSFWCSVAGILTLLAFVALVIILIIKNYYCYHETSSLAPSVLFLLSPILILASFHMLIK